MQDFMVTGLFAGQHNTKLHGTITGVICSFVQLSLHQVETRQIQYWDSASMFASQHNTTGSKNKMKIKSHFFLNFNRRRNFQGSILLTKESKKSTVSLFITVVDVRFLWTVSSIILYIV